ncbi:MAG: Thymidylate kinase [Candidatus Celerinatantimonas neptuna]|nr:MAG: Thymidylate kinase [Candidatus Celerinatantimonas neptuna]
MNGQFIVIEGLEGAGKSTAVRTIQSWLEEKRIEYITTREPGGTPLAERLRDLVKNFHDESITSETELLLMYAARSQLIANKIRPALNEGKWVIGDRHDLSSRAYQGGGRQLPMSQLDQLRNLVLGNFRPSLTLYLDIDPVLGLSRARHRGDLDRIEKQQIDFFERVREVYLDEQRRDSTIFKVDASQSIEEINHHINQILEKFLQENRI